MKLSLQEIMSLSADEFADLGRKEQVQVINQINSAANKRVRRAVAGGYNKLSPAVSSAIKKHGGNKNNPFSLQGTKRNKNGEYKQSALSNAFSDAKEFLKLKTSTKAGTEALQKAVEERLGGKFRSKRLANSFWETYKKFLETDDGKALVSKGNSAEVQEYLYKIMGNHTIKTEKRGLDKYIDPAEEQKIFDKLAAFADEVNRSAINNANDDERKAVSQIIAQIDEAETISIGSNRKKGKRNK